MPGISQPENRTDPPMLLAILRAARLTGDRAMERAARRLLRDEHGIEVSFRREHPAVMCGGDKK